MVRGPRASRSDLGASRCEVCGMSCVLSRVCSLDGIARRALRIANKLQIIDGLAGHFDIDVNNVI